VKAILEKIDALQKEINTLRPLGPGTVKSLRDYYRIGLTWSSNAMEGNTLTESETKVVIEDGLTIGGKPLRDHLEAYGHAGAFDRMIELVDKKKVDEKDVLDLHRIFYMKIDEAQAGKYRVDRVVISGSRYPLPVPDKVPGLMKELVERIARMRESEHPVIAAARAHLEFVFIHPFIDGNGRVARLLMNLVLLQEGYSIGLIPPVLRAGYISSLETAHENDRQCVELICRSVHETQKYYLRLLTS
jgi:Fic family protein